MAKVLPDQEWEGYRVASQQTFILRGPLQETVPKTIRKVPITQCDVFFETGNYGVRLI